MKSSTGIPIMSLKINCIRTCSRYRLKIWATGILIWSISKKKLRVCFYSSTLITSMKTFKKFSYRSPTHHAPYNYEEDEIYHKNVAAVPFWYHTAVCIILSALGISGIFLNGFIVWCFGLRPIVSFSIFQKYLMN